MTVKATFLGSGFDFKKKRSTKSFLSLRPLKQKKNIGSKLKYVVLILIFLIENRVLRKTLKKFRI